MKFYCKYFYSASYRRSRRRVESDNLWSAGIFTIVSDVFHLAPCFAFDDVISDGEVASKNRINDCLSYCQKGSTPSSSLTGCSRKRYGYSFYNNITKVCLCAHEDKSSNKTCDLGCDILNENCSDNNTINEIQFREKRSFSHWLFCLNISSEIKTGVPFTVTADGSQLGRF